MTRLSAAAALFLLAVVPGTAQSISAGGIIDGAGFVVGQPVAAGSVVSIFGTGLATSLQAGDTIPLSNVIGNTSVTFNGISAPLYFVSGGQVNAQVPWNVLPSGELTGTANVVVSVNGVASAPQSVAIGQFSPNLFAAGGFAIAINPDGTLAAPVNSIPGLPTRPARAGEALLLLANGLGAVNPEIQSGHPGLPVRNTTTTPEVLFGGVPATPGFSGLSPEFPGINQINVVVPSGITGSAVPLQLRMGGVTSSDQVIIAIAP